MTIEIEKVRPKSYHFNDDISPGRNVRADNIKKSSFKNFVDIFILHKETEESKDGKFTFAQMGTRFLQGLFSPISALIQNPLLAVPMVASGLALAFFVPGSVPLMLIGGGLFSLFEIGLGVLNLTRSAINGDKDGMEDSFKNFGSGLIGAAFTLIGVRSSATIAVEAKATSAALKAGATKTEAVIKGLETIKKTKPVNYLEAAKENLSMLNKDGLLAVKDSFKTASVKRNLLAQVAKENNTPKKLNQSALTEQELAKPLSSSELKSFCEDFNISFSDLKKNLNKMSKEEFIKFRSSVRRNPYKVAKDTFRALIGDEDVATISKALDVSEDNFRLFLANVEEDDMSLVVQAIREARNINESMIEKMIWETFNKEVSRISSKLNIPENIIKQCIKPEFVHSGLGMFNPADYKMRFNAKGFRYSLIQDIYSKYNGTPDQGPLAFRVGIRETVTDTVSHECKHLEQALERFIHLPVEDTFNVAIELALEEISTGHPKIILVGDSQGHKFIKVPRLPNSIKEEFTALVEAVYRRTGNHQDRHDRFTKLFNASDNVMDEFIRLNPEGIQEVLAKNSLWGNDQVARRYAASKLFHEYKLDVFYRPQFIREIVKSPHLDDRLASLRQFVSPKPVGKQTLVDEVRAIIQTTEVNAKGGFFGIFTDEEYLLYLNSPHEVEARMYSTLTRVKELHSAIIQGIKNLDSRRITDYRQRLNLIECELLSEAVNYRNPQTAELKKQLSEIDTIINELRGEVAIAELKLKITSDKLSVERNPVPFLLSACYFCSYLTKKLSEVLESFLNHSTKLQTSVALTKNNTLTIST